jgi:branched-chain amino acid transport system permease protein
VALSVLLTHRLRGSIRSDAWREDPELMSRHAAHGRTVGRVVAGLVLGLLVAPLLLLLGGTSAQAATLCVPKVDELGCIQGTIGNRADPIEGVDVILTKPDGSTETQTTEDDGKFSFQVTESGEYLVGIDQETMPDGIEFKPPTGDLLGEGDTYKVTIDLSSPQTANRVANLDVGPPAPEARSTLDKVTQSAFNGLRLGLLLALASVGLSLIYGTTGLSNFAHAEQVTLGGMLAYLFVNQQGMPLLVGGLLVVVACGFTGWFQDRILWQPLRRRGLGLTQMMIVTIGLSLAIQYSYQFLVGSRTVRVIVDNPTVTSFGPITTTDQSLVAMLICAVVLAGVGYALLRTRIGRATRAVSDNPALAQASGIDTDKVIRLVWTIAMGLAGLSGILYALVTNGVKWDTGLQILLLLFAAVTLGGLGTAFGALVGSLVIGFVVEMSPLLPFVPGDFKYAVALLILIVVLLVRPQGLLGKAQRVG